MDQIREVSTEEDIDILINLYSNDLIEQKRIKTDFISGYFKCLISPTTDNQINGYLVYYNTYSTWQHRTYFVSNIWLNPNLSEEEQFNELKYLFEKLLSISRDNSINRVNMNLNLVDEKICNWVQQIGVVDLSAKEDWIIMEMQNSEMNEFVSNKAELKPEFKIVKASEIKQYSEAVRNLIYELSVFEKLAEQCEVTETELIRDFKPTDRKLFDDKITVQDRFYELSVVMKGDTVVGFAIYYLKYELKNGLGFYLEDLYVVNEYRGCGLGTSLWQFVINDVLGSHRISYMQWCVLNWNTMAIDFYYKYKSRNLTELFQTHFFRILKDTIYAKN